MHVGDSIIVSVPVEQYDETGAIIVPKSPTVVVTQPDGTAVSPAPSVTVLPSGDDVPYRLSALVTPSQGGNYRFAWSYSGPSSQALQFTRDRFAVWTDPYGLIRQRLQRPGLPEQLLEAEYARVARRYLARYPCIGNGVGSAATMGVYNLLAGDDQEWFDEAVALAVCCRLVGPLNNGGGAVDLQSVKYGDQADTAISLNSNRTQSLLSPGDSGAGPGGYAGQHERERWYRESAESLMRVSWVRQEVVGNAGTFQMFRASGPSRTAINNGAVPTFMAEVIRLITDDTIDTYYGGGVENGDY